MLSFLFLGDKKDYEVGPTDVLRYLKDNTDVRTRHAAYGKSQTIKAVTELMEKNKTLRLDSRTFLYQVTCIMQFCNLLNLFLKYWSQALNNERQRLHVACQQWVATSVGEDTRLLHFGVYLLTNQVSFEPFVYWTLLQHFSSYSLLLDEE